MPEAKTICCVAYLSFALHISTVLLVLFPSADNKVLWRNFFFGEFLVTLSPPLVCPCPSTVYPTVVLESRGTGGIAHQEHLAVSRETCRAPWAGRASWACRSCRRSGCSQRNPESFRQWTATRTFSSQGRELIIEWNWEGITHILLGLFYSLSFDIVTSWRRSWYLGLARMTGFFFLLNFLATGCLQHPKGTFSQDFFS